MYLYFYHSVTQLQQADISSYSPLTQTQYPDQSSVNLTRAWSHDKSSIEGLSGLDRAAETHKLLKDMASHNTAYNDIVTMSLELHINTRGKIGLVVVCSDKFLKILSFFLSKLASTVNLCLLLMYLRLCVANLGGNFLPASFNLLEDCLLNMKKQDFLRGTNATLIAFEGVGLFLYYVWYYIILS